MRGLRVCAVQDGDGRQPPVYPERQVRGMNKTDLTVAIAESADISKAAAGKALDAVIDSITEALQKGDDVVLTGFGTFSVKERPERTGRNPQTGAAIKIEAAKVPGFKAGKGLTDAVR
ncbi:HU family DNA-binding protein [Streptomyces sp. NPDC059466]|uniref:HU family DNA-binding protein n=1 Tax=unclassified Streptomyces TaxID=2593676 RepID=UPI0036940304